MAGLACPMACHSACRTETSGKIDPQNQTVDKKKKENYEMYLIQLLVFLLGRLPWWDQAQ